VRERVMAIVDLIAQYVLGAKDTQVNEQELMAELVSAGFEVEEINGAFAWMEATALPPAPEVQQANDLLQQNPNYRLFSAAEQQVLSTEAQGFLVKVRAMGLLNNEAHEEIIERILNATKDPVGLHEVKLVTIMTLLSQTNNLWLREIDCFLENDWDRIYH